MFVCVSLPLLALLSASPSSRFSPPVLAFLLSFFLASRAATTKNKTEDTASTHPPPVLMGGGSGEIPGRRGRGVNSGAHFFFFFPEKN